MVARSIPKNYRTVTGRFASAKNRQLIGFESTLEKDFFLLLELDPGVASFEEQPVTITYSDIAGRVRRYTPDVLVHHRCTAASGPGERPILYEVKYCSDLRERGKAYRPKFIAARRYARERGWRFRVITERKIRTPRLRNLRFLRRYRRLRIDEDVRQALLTVLRERGPVEPETLLEWARPPVGQRAETLAALWHLVATGQIDTDLDQPLTPHSILRWGRTDGECHRSHCNGETGKWL